MITQFLLKNCDDCMILIENFSSFFIKLITIRNLKSLRSDFKVVTWLPFYYDCNIFFWQQRYEIN